MTDEEILQACDRAYNIGYKHGSSSKYTEFKLMLHSTVLDLQAEQAKIQ